MAPRPRGRLAQLVEHLVYTERVGGSSPSPPTMQQRAALPVPNLAGGCDQITGTGPTSAK